VKPLWKEGLFIMPQHLQLMDEFHERLLDARLGALAAHAWGVSELEVDADELARGVFAPTRCVAVMPDGMLVELSQPGAGVSVMASGGLAGGGQKIDLYLAVPSRAAGGVSADPRSAGARYLHKVVTVADAYGSAQEVDLDCLTPNARLLLGNEQRQNYVTVKLAELELGESGRARVRERYIPPCLKVRASPYLMEQLGRLVAALGAKQRELSSKYGDRMAAIVEFGAADVATFLYLHTVNSWLPVLMHAVDSGELHTEQLYLTLATLAGQLASFEGSADPLELPRFVYTDLETTFVPLFDLIFRLLGTVVSARYRSIPLEQTQPGLFVGRPEDGRLLQQYSLYLVIGGDVPEDTLREDLPRYIKVGSMDQIAKIVHSALPGVPVRIDFSPPNAIPVRAHMVYLKLDRQGRYWESVTQSGTIAIYQPVRPDRVKLELLAVED
jgi:type VI secretion system protein ImpJ